MTVEHLLKDNAHRAIDTGMEYAATYGTPQSITLTFYFEEAYISHDIRVNSVGEIEESGVLTTEEEIDFKAMIEEVIREKFPALAAMGTAQ